MLRRQLNKLEQDRVTLDRLDVWTDCILTDPSKSCYTMAVALSLKSTNIMFRQTH